MQKQQPGKILIIQTAFIGDVVLATPLIEALSAAFPQAKIDFLLRKGNESLLQAHPKLNEVLIWDKKQNKSRNLMALIRRIRKRHYDAVFNAQRFFSSGLITALSGANYTAGFDKNPLSFRFDFRVQHEISAEGSKHETERNLQLISEFVPNAKAPVRLYPTQQDYQKVAEYQKDPYLVIAPASVWFTKQYPVSKWVEFIKSVGNAYKIYLTGAASDDSIAEEIIRKSECSNCINLCGKLRMLETAALMEQAAMNYVNDSAPMHFASAVNAKTCAIFCSTVPQFGFGPLSEHSTVVEISEKLACRPCGLHGKKECPEGHFDCAMKINNQDLLSALAK